MCNPFVALNVGCQRRTANPVVMRATERVAATDARTRSRSMARAVVVAHVREAVVLAVS